jgi:hypothetical protein
MGEHRFGAGRGTKISSTSRYGLRSGLEPRDLPRQIRIARAELGDDAGLIGAAGWTRTFDPAPAPEAAPA